MCSRGSLARGSVCSRGRVRSVRRVRCVGRSPENQFRFPRVVRHVFTSWAVWCESFVGLGFRSSPVGFSSLLFHDFHDMSTVFDMDFDRFVFCSFGSGVQQRMERDWFIPPLPFGSSSVQRSKLDLRVSPCCPAGCKKARGHGWWKRKREKGLPP